MTNALSSAIFCVRNVDKTKHGEVGRSAVAVGQAKKVVDSVMKIDGKIGKGTTKAIENVINFSNKSKTLQFSGKIIKFASDNINPLICVSSGIKVAMAEDKETTFINEAGALSGMFLAEKHAKKGLNKLFESKTVTELCEKGVKAADAKGYKAISSAIKSSPTVLKGLFFVFASIGGYTIGSKIAKKITHTNENENIFAKTNTEIKSEKNIPEVKKNETVQEPALEVQA